MKNIKHLFVLLIVATLFSGCSSNDDTNDNNNSFYMRAKIDGVQYEVTGELLCTYVNNQTFNIQSVKMTGTEGFTFTIFPNTISVQNYNMQQTTDNIVLASYFVGNVSFNTTQTNEGNITIQEYNPETKIVKGTFNFKAKDLDGNVTKIVTDGSFRCKGLN